MFDIEQVGKMAELRAGKAALCGKGAFDSALSETFNLSMQGIGELFEDDAQFGGLSGDNSLST